MTPDPGYSRLPVIFQQCREHAKVCGAHSAHVARVTYRQFAALALDGRLPNVVRFRERWYALEAAVPEIAVAAGLLPAETIAATGYPSASSAAPLPVPA